LVGGWARGGVPRGGRGGGSFGGGGRSGGGGGVSVGRDGGGVHVVDMNEWGGGGEGKEFACIPTTR